LTSFFLAMISVTDASSLQQALVIHAQRFPAEAYFS